MRRDAVAGQATELVLLSVLNRSRAKSARLFDAQKACRLSAGYSRRFYKTIGLNWERIGNVRFAVTYKPQNDTLDRAYAKERAMQVAKEWSEAMQTGGAVRKGLYHDRHDVQIKVIGADNQILDSEVPVRQMLEQIVAKPDCRLLCSACHGHRRSVCRLSRRTCSPARSTHTAAF